MVKGALQRMAMMRSYMRAESSGAEYDDSRLERVGLTTQQVKEMYRLLAIAKYEDRFVIPTSHKEQHLDVYRSQGFEGFESGCGGCGPDNPFDKSGKELYEENFYGGIWRD